MSDLIDRQAAIDEVARWTGYLDEDMITRIQIGLKRLPSAQPEIIRCKDCKYAKPSEQFSNTFNCEFMPATGQKPHDFCSHAKPRNN